MIQQILNRLTEGEHLEEDTARSVMLSMMNGEATGAQIAGLLIALKMKGETVDEISGFVRAMREKSAPFKGGNGLVDTCGTGGDGSGSFNISTAAAVVAAAAGVPVAKHGNRSVSSRCGSADVLRELGVNLDLTPQQVQECLEGIGLAFLYAPLFHASMKYAGGPRREMGVRTVFNILGPMSNPAGVKRQLIGTFNPAVAGTMAQVLRNTGSEHIILVHSEDGLDEISIAAPTKICELKDGEIRHYRSRPEDFGMRTRKAALVGGDPATNAGLLNRIFEGGQTPHTDVTALNAGTAIYVGGRAESIRQGVEMALEVLRSGAAKKKLAELIDFSRSC